MNNPTTETCPMCKQKIKNGKPLRYCFNCKNPMGSHDKYVLVTGDDFKTYLVHKHCDNPQSYYPKGAAK